MDGVIPGTGNVSTEIETTETVDLQTGQAESTTVITEEVANPVTAENIQETVAAAIQSQAEEIGAEIENAVVCRKIYSAVSTLTESLQSLNSKTETVQTSLELLSMRLSELAATLAEAVTAANEETQETATQETAPVVTVGANQETRKASLLDVFR